MPAIVEVGSHLDNTHLAILEDAKLWLSRNADAGLDMSLATFLRPFPTFKPRHLSRVSSELVLDRALIPLHENLEEPNAISTAYNPEAETKFKELLLTASWMCEDPEKRLYKTPEKISNKRLNRLLRSSPSLGLPTADTPENKSNKRPNELLMKSPSSGLHTADNTEPRPEGDGNDYEVNAVSVTTDVQSQADSEILFTPTASRASSPSPAN